VISNESKKQLLDVKRHVKNFSAYNLLGYDDDKYYAPTGEKTVRIGLVAAKKQFFTAKNRDILLILRHLSVIF
jgi:hypothetical protein